MRNRNNNENKLAFKKFQISKINNPQLIFGGKVNVYTDEDEDDVDTGDSRGN